MNHKMGEELSQFLEEIAGQRRFVRESRDVVMTNKVKIKPFASFESTETAVDLLKAILQPNVSFEAEDILPSDDDYDNEEDNE